ncbi:unnamed protein product [Cuscuta campestris]|uniref:Pentacotripeptide-repeat region of PRORP domain-containing protein n=1 Tax=Cuscuta campestris TaxID=132261 RepID=A0A484N0F0_9ASTE|nr:unnamed protein product [Cuscuta campestris]
MLLYSAAATIDYHRLRRLSFSPSPPNLLSPPSGLSRSALLKPPQIPAICCSSKPHSRSSGTVESEETKTLNWYTIYKKITRVGLPPEGDAATVLDEYEKSGIKIAKFDISRIIKELRKAGRPKHALQVHEWVKDRADVYHLTAVDISIYLYLIYEVHGISKAEDYFTSLPESLKKKHVYRSLLRVYARSGVREKAESLFEEMRNRGYASTSAHPYNAMMDLYLKLKDYDKVEGMIVEMVEKNILDVFSYNVWLRCCGLQGSAEKMELVFERMKRDPSVIPNKKTHIAMASSFIEMGELEKAKDCLKRLELGIKDRITYHYLISHYGNVGDREAIHRVWNVYKSKFSYIPNTGYQSVISSLLRVDDIESAEKMFDGWMSAKTRHDPNIVNHLLSWYLKKKQLEKCESVFSSTVDAGGKPDTYTLDIMAQVHIKKGRKMEALSCFRDAASAEGSSSWRPSNATIASFIKLCDEEDDVKSKEELVEVLSGTGCFKYEDYVSYVASQNGLGGDRKTESEKDGDEMSEPFYPLEF